MATNYLGGIPVTLNDGGLRIAPPPSGPRVMLLGVTSNTGIPALEPFTVTSVEKAVNQLWVEGTETYGTTGRYPGELARAVEAASIAGAQNIEVCVIAHKSGADLEAYCSPLTNHSGRYADLEAAYGVLRNRELDVVVPVGVGIDEHATTGVSTAVNFGTQLANFCHLATKEENAAIGVIPTMPVMSWALRNGPGIAQVSEALMTELSGLSFVTGAGADCTGVPTGEQLRTAYANTMFATPSSALLDLWVKVHTLQTGDADAQLILTGAFAGGSMASVSAAYKNWLHGAADQNGNILSAIDASTATDVHANYWTNWQAKDSDGSPDYDSKGLRVDAGRYISVFSAPVVAVGSSLTSSTAIAFGSSPATTTINVDGAVSYAGSIISLSPGVSTLNRPVVGLNYLRLLSIAQANKLTGMRHVTMLSRSRGLVVADGVTGAYNVSPYVRSDYVRLTTMRIVNSVVDAIRQRLERYLGLRNNAPTLNHMEADVSQIIQQHIQNGWLNDADHTISSTPEQQVLNIVQVDLTLVPAFDIKEIQVGVSLAKSL